MWCMQSLISFVSSAGWANNTDIPHHKIPPIFPNSCPRHFHSHVSSPENPLRNRSDISPRQPRSHQLSVTVHVGCLCTCPIICGAQLYSVSQKSSPLKPFAAFSLLVNLCNWKLSWLLPKYMTISTPILVHLSEYLREMYHFYRCDPSNF